MLVSDCVIVDRVDDGSDHILLGYSVADDAELGPVLPRPHFDDSLFVDPYELRMDPEAAKKRGQLGEPLETLVIDVYNIDMRKVPEVVEPNGYLLDEDVRC